MKIKIPLHWQIFISLILSMLASWGLKGQWGVESSVTVNFIEMCNFIGELFMNALKMIVVPLIAASIVSGMIGLGAERRFGRMGLKTIAFYLSTTFIACIIGLLGVNLIQPGKVTGEAAKVMLAQAQAPSYIAEHAAHFGTSELLNVFIKMIPPNVFSAASDNSQLLGVIIFCLLFGFFVTRLPLKHRRFQVKLWQSFQEVMLKMADLILLFAPIGVFALVTPKFIDFGFHLFLPLMKFTTTVLLALAFQVFVVLSICLLVMRINPIDHLKAMTPAMMTAFSTASSVTTIPITMECVEKTAGVSNRVSSFTVPLGATVNMNGTALYECIVVIFVAQFYQAVIDPSFDLTISSQIMIVLLSLFTSIGVAGIPAASLVAIALIMNVVNLPFEYVGMVLVVDRILDMCRTVVNIFGDSVAAVVIGKSEGETEIYRKAV